LIAAINKGLRPKYLFFWGHHPAKDGQISKSCLVSGEQCPLSSMARTKFTGICADEGSHPSSQWGDKLTSIWIGSLSVAKINIFGCH
jgi:hypothetical protein